MKNILVLLAILFVAPSAMGQKISKQEKKANGYAAMKKMVKEGVWEFQAAEATTAQGGRVGMNDNPNYMRVKEGSAQADMPYFGNSLMPSSAKDSGIVFDYTTMENYEVKFNDDKQKISIEFRIRSNEMYLITVNIFWSQRATMTIKGLTRNVITYTGGVGMPSK